MIAALESQAIEIIREAIATARNPVMLYSMGKDSTALLHLAKKAFYPAPLPFPLLHVDTRWKFRDMYAHRERVASESGVTMIVYTNPEGLSAGVGPLTHGSSYHTDVMKTQALRQALSAHDFDVVLGGARRDEEMSRAKERVFSIRSANHRWDPKAQRPEMWRLFNTHLGVGESLRVFPLSDWTEIDVWRYIQRERLPVVPLYFAQDRPVIRRDGQWIMVDDDRLPMRAGEQPQIRRVRFRSLGCYPLSAAVDSDAGSVEAVIAELVHVRQSERAGRLIDADGPGSMERKKREGYF